MFNLQTASSGVKKAAYRLGIRSGKYEPHFANEPFEKMVTVYGDNGKVAEITQIDAELADDYTWKEIRSGQ